MLTIGQYKAIVVRRIYGIKEEMDMLSMRGASGR